MIKYLVVSFFDGDRLETHLYGIGQRLLFLFDCSRDEQGRALGLILQVHPPPQEDLPFQSPQRRLVKLKYCGQHSLPIYRDVISQIVIVLTSNTE